MEIKKRKKRANERVREQNCKSCDENKHTRKFYTTTYCVNSNFVFENHNVHKKKVHVHIKIRRRCMMAG